MGEGIARFDAVPRWTAALGVAAAHFALSAASLALARWSNGIAVIWPANAVLLCYLLIRHPRDWPLPVGLTSVACMAISLLTHRALDLALFFAVANVAECTLAATVLRMLTRSRSDLERLSTLIPFMLAVVGATISSATVASFGLMLTGDTFVAGWLSWFTPDVLGLLIVTPILLVVRKALFDRNPVDARSLAEAVLALGLVAGASMFVFLQSSWPLLFLIAPPVLVATFRLRGVGASLSVLIVVMIGSAGTVFGTGPLVLVHGSVGEHLVLFQIFLATLILTALPIAAILAERDSFSRRVQASEGRFRAVVEVVSDVIFRTDARGRWTFLNPAWERLTGYSVEETLGQSFLHHVLAEDREPLLSRLRALEESAEPVRHQVRFRNAEGEEQWIEVLSHRLLDEEDRMIGTAGTVVDISDRIALAAMTEAARRQAEQNAEVALRLAATDGLTGVASRRAFLAYFEQQLSELEEDRALSIALFDLDHFKQVNDRFGHAVGDEVLRRVAVIAGRCVREGDLIGRIGGEEFAILMPGASIEQAARAAERLRAACLSMSRRDDNGPSVTISIGVATARPGSTSAALLREADAALYRAKAEGRNCLRLAA